jgi:hypothetical protein
MEDNNKLDVKEIECMSKGVVWIQLTQDMVQSWAFFNTLMNLRFQ